MSPPRPLLRALFLLAALAGGLGLWRISTGRAPATGSGDRLTAGDRFTRDLGAGESHAFGIVLDAGERIDLGVEQQGIDVELILTGPDGGEDLVVDSPTGPYGEERLVALARSAGTHRLLVRPFPGGRGGRYRLEVDALGPPEPRDLDRAAAVAALARATAALTAGSAGSAGAAGDADAALRAARRHARAARDALLAAEALDRLAHGETAAGRLDVAERLHVQAAAELGAAGASEHRRGFALALAGKAAFDAGRTEQALGLFRQAVEALGKTPDRHETGIAHYNVGHSLDRLGRIEPALAAYRRSVRLLAHLPGSEVAAAKALHNLGGLEVAVGETALGRDHLASAERLLRGVRGEERLRGLVLLALGNLEIAVGDLDRANRHLRDARAQSRSAGDRRSAAVAETALALVARRRGDLGEALDGYRRAIDELHDVGTDPGSSRGTRRLEARVLHHLGSLQLRRGEPAAARRAYERARELVGSAAPVGDPAYEADARLGLARAARLVGDHDQAWRHSEAGLAVVETLRAEILAPSLATSWFAGVQEHYRFAIDLAMELDRRRPGTGWAARGLEVAERARARALLDALGLAAGGPSGVGPERRLRERLAGAERVRLGRLETGASPETVEAAERRVRELLVELEETIRRRRAENRRSERLRPEPLGAEAIRTRLTGSGTRLVELAVGPERSHLWVVGPEGLEAFALPAGPEIEPLARHAHSLLARGAGPEAHAAAGQALCLLSRKVLGPAAAELTGRRLLVVPDGALSYLPFAALPDPAELARGVPCADAPPLAARFEIVHLPSASAAARLAERPGAGPRRGTLAVMADPVFSADDARLERPTEAQVARGWAGERRLARLDGTRREAEAILSRVAPEEAWSAHGFAASRQAVLAGRLSGYRYLHLATHGFVHDEHPELSGLVLSRFTADGRERDGFLRVHELAELDLSADLVTLSACRTALGAETRGEGLVGMTQALLAAGARSVLVSLWNVGDRSTAELMERFYEALLTDELTPAAALRRTQLEMAADPRWREPYHWAGFVLVGTG